MCYLWNRTSSYILILLIVSVLFICCQSEKKDETRICTCPINELVSTQTDTSIIQNGNQTDWQLNGKISLEVKKIINTELGGKWDSKQSIKSIKKVIRKIDNEFPEFSCETYQTRVGSLFYCAYYELCCRDTSLTLSEIRIMCTKRLDEFKEEVKTTCGKIESKVSKTSIQKEKTRIVKPKIKKTFNVKFSFDEKMTGCEVYTNGKPAKIMDEVGIIGTDGFTFIQVEESEEPLNFTFVTNDRKCFEAKRFISKDTEISNFKPIDCKSKSFL